MSCRVQRRDGERDGCELVIARLGPEGSTHVAFQITLWRLARLDCTVRMGAYALSEGLSASRGVYTSLLSSAENIEVSLLNACHRV